MHRPDRTYFALIFCERPFFGGDHSRANQAAFSAAPMGPHDGSATRPRTVCDRDWSRHELVIAITYKWSCTSLWVADISPSTPLARSPGVRTTDRCDAPSHPPTVGFRCQGQPDGPPLVLEAQELAPPLVSAVLERMLARSAASAPPQGGLGS